MNRSEKYYEWEKYDKVIGRMIFDIIDSLRPRGYYDEKYQYHEIPRPTDEEDEYLKELAELLRTTRYFTRAHMHELKGQWHEVCERKRNDGLVHNTH